jgi:AraC-like DNA-binding protein
MLMVFFIKNKYKKSIYMIDLNLSKDIKKYDFITGRDLYISKKGKHSVDFEKDFPLITKVVQFYINYNLTPNYHDYLEITYILKGTGSYIAGEKKYFINEGDIIVVNNIDLHTWLADHNTSMYLVSIFFLPDLLYKPGGNDYELDFLSIFFNRGKNFTPRISNSEITKKVSKLISTIHFNLNKKDKYFKIKSKALLEELIIFLLDYFKENISYSREIYDQHYKEIVKIRDVFALLNNNFNRNITLGEAAKVVSLSPQHFCKVFKKVTGITFKEYLIKLRIDKSKELMLEDSLSVTDIAYRVGFESLSYFYKAFRKFTKINPTEFRSTLKLNY